jgi:hypothetical protein
LQKELVEVIRKYVNIGNDDVQSHWKTRAAARFWNSTSPCLIAEFSSPRYTVWERACPRWPSDAIAGQPLHNALRERPNMPLSNIQILHQDAAVLVVNKPTLLLSVPGRADDNKDCLITRLQENGYPEARSSTAWTGKPPASSCWPVTPTATANCRASFTTAKPKRPTPRCAGVSRSWTAAASTCRCATTHRPSRATWSTMNSASTP